MATSSLFSVPVAVVLNQRLVSQRGGIVPQTSQSEDSLRFKLFINSNPSSARYGLTLQISALRDMSKEHNVDQIPEHPAYIYFPTNSFFHYSSVTPSHTGIQHEEGEELNINQELAFDITRTFRMFRAKGNFDELRHLIVKCSSAVIDSNTIPKLRSEVLEWELKRIFGTITTANELEDACLELDCLLPAMKGETDRAVKVMHDAALKILLIREVQKLAMETNQLANFGHEKPEPKEESPLKANAQKKKFVWKEKSDAAKVELNGQEKSSAEMKNKENTPKRPFIPAIIDGHFVSPNQNPLLRKASRTSTDRSGDATPRTSPNKYLHPHTFDSGDTKQIRSTVSEKSSPKAKTVENPPSGPTEGVPTKDLVDALEFLGVSESTPSDEIEAAAYSLASNGGNKEKIASALNSIAICRGNDGKLQEAAPRIASSVTTLSEAYSRLRIGCNGHHASDENVLEKYMNLSLNVPAKWKGNYDEALRMIAHDRRSFYLLAKLENPNADVQPSK